MITRDSIETAYSFLHQKRNVYIHSSLDWQKEDIEYAIASYAEEMNPELLDEISDGRALHRRTVSSRAVSGQNGLQLSKLF